MTPVIRPICTQEVRGSTPLGSTGKSALFLSEEQGVRALNVPLARRVGFAGAAFPFGSPAARATNDSAFASVGPYACPWETRLT